MSVPPPDVLHCLRETAFAARRPVDVMLAHWQAINADVARLRQLADLGVCGSAEGPAAFITALTTSSDGQRELAWQGVEDIAAMLAAGMAALDVLASRGIAAQTPALALWREVDAAQRSLLAMLAGDAAGPAAAVAATG